MEIASNSIQLVEQNQNVLFTETPVCGGNCIKHRDGSGIVTLRGMTNQCNARFRIFFSGNIAIPTGGTVEEISLAIAISGEPVQTSRVRTTPAAVEQYENVSSAIFVNVPRGCCFEIAIENTSAQSINVQNANLIVERVA